MDEKETLAIKARYDVLATQPSAGLSCGGAAALVDARAGDVCVDLGCGRGRDLVALAGRVGASGHVFGIDASPKMIEAAAATLRERGVVNASLHSATLDALPLGDGSVDWVVSNCALNHARDKARVWSEIARVLRPGGRFVVSDIYAVEPIAQRWRDDPVAVAECWAGAETRAEYLAHVALAGLVDVAVKEERAPYRKQEATLSSFTLMGRKPHASEVDAESETNRHERKRGDEIADQEA
ncbi:MAG: methyltransferase domain-containing protein [Polyangiaceae bacterium]